MTVNCGEPGERGQTFHNYNLMMLHICKYLSSLVMSTNDVGGSSILPLITSPKVLNIIFTEFDAVTKWLLNKTKQEFVMNIIYSHFNRLYKILQCLWVFLKLKTIKKQ
jgi:hypothetical protein